MSSSVTRARLLRVESLGSILLLLLTHLQDSLEQEEEGRRRKEHVHC
jgi:hypothetical protein